MADGFYDILADTTLISRIGAAENASGDTIALGSLELNDANSSDSFSATPAGISHSADGFGTIFQTVANDRRVSIGGDLLFDNDNRTINSAQSGGASSLPSNPQTYIQVLANVGGSRIPVAIPAYALDQTAPTDPSNLSMCQYTGAPTNAIRLDWDASSDASGVDYYTVYRSSDGTNFSSIATVDDPTTQYDDTNATLQPDTTFYYYVTATDINGNVSGQSNEVSGTYNSISVC